MLLFPFFVWAFAPCTLACFVISEEKHSLNLKFDQGLEYDVHLFSDLGSDTELICYKDFNQFVFGKLKPCVTYKYIPSRCYGHFPC